MRELVDKHGGGVWKGRKAKGCIPGGISMGIMTEAEFDTPLDFAGPGKVGCLGLGTAAVTVFDEETSIVDVLYNICRFFAHESCGQCTPCREGTGWMLKITDRLRRGQGRLEDLKILEEVGDKIGIMPGTTICGLADGAGWPVKNAIRKFRAGVRAVHPQGHGRVAVGGSLVSGSLTRSLAVERGVVAMRLSLRSNRLRTDRLAAALLLPGSPGARRPPAKQERPSQTTGRRAAPQGNPVMPRPGNSSERRRRPERAPQAARRDSGSRPD